MGSSGGSGGGQTVTQVQQIPEYEQQFSQENQDLARSLAGTTYQQVAPQGNFIAPLTPYQNQGISAAANAATSYQPQMQQAIGAATGALDSPNQGFAQGGGLIGQGAALSANAPASFQPYLNAATAMTNQAANSYQPNLAGANALTMGGAQGWNSGAAAQYMDPYVMQALAPALQQLGISQQQQQNQIGAQATQAGAFGDARQGAAESLNNFYGNLAQNDLIGQGMSQAYNSGLGAFQADQSRQLTAGGQMGNLGALQQQLQLNPASMLANLGSTNSGLQLQAGNQLGQMGTDLGGLAAQQGQLNLSQAGMLGNLAGQNQQLGIAGSNALFDAGSQQQQQLQQLLNYNYQQQQNQANWPFQMLNMRESALSNSPYTVANSTTLPSANMTAQNLGAFGALAGGVGSLLGGGGSGAAPFGGTAFK